MNELARTTKPRTRGRGFPVVPLGEAVDIVRKAGRYGRRHNLEAFASYMGHTTTNSGAFKQRLASMKEWSLLRVDGNVIVLTDLAIVLAHPPSPEAEEDALREAFHRADVFSRIFEASAKGEELQLTALANSAVHNLGVSPQSKERFAKAFVQSAVAAGLARDVGGGRVIFDGSPETSAPVDGRASLDRGPMSQRPPEQTAAPNAAPVIRQTWPLSGGELLFEVRLDQPMPAASLSELAAVFEAVENLVETLSGNDKETPVEG